MDLLTDVLAAGGVRGTLGARVSAAETWGVAWLDVDTSVFYAVTAGTAWLGIEGRAPIQLMPGDVVLLPAGTGHTLTSEPGAVANSCDHLEAERARLRGSELHFGQGPAQTHILGASYAHDPVVSTQVLRLLPEVVHIRSANGGTCLDDTVRLLGRELANPQVASGLVLDRLVDVLLVQLLRVWLATHPDEAAGSWFGVLDDPLVARAMGLLHADPARAWTSDVLAAELDVSRATLSRRFTERIGTTPTAYLTSRRMDLAAVRLRDTADTLERIAASVGYTSVYAFSRAFSRAKGAAPGRFRSAQRQAA